jgi:hypothetical protein
VTFCILLIFSFFIDAQIPIFVFVIAGILVVDEIAVFLMGYIDGKEDRKNRGVYKDYRRK